MKRSKVTIAMLLALLLLTPTPFAGTLKSQPSGDIPDIFDMPEIPDFDWSLFFPEGYDGDWDDDDDIIDGGHLGEATITCSSKGYGRCYKWKTNIHMEHIMETPVVYESHGFFSGCYVTGSMEDRCRLIWHLLYSTIMSTAYGQTAD